MATIKEIADRLGVSPGTVSKGLNGAKDVSEGLRQKILDTAVQMGYTKKSAVKTKTRKLAVFVENMGADTKNDFGYEVVLGFRQAAFKEDWGVDVIPLSVDLQKKYPYDTYMLENGYSGSFMLGLKLDDPWMKDFETTNVPTMLLDNHLRHNPKTGCVGTDSVEGLDLAVDHLASLGHKRIAFLNGSSGSSITEMRMKAFQLSMREHDLTFDPELTAFDDFTAEAAARHVKGFLDAGATAIICGNDLIASGVIKECRKVGKHVPTDISVIGYDDMPIAASLIPPLTSIRQDRLNLGKCGYFVLYAMINGVALSKNYLRPALIKRTSTAQAK